MKLNYINLKKGLVSWVILTFVFNFVFFPLPILAQEKESRQEISLPVIKKAMAFEYLNQNRLPETEARTWETVRTIKIPVTAYNAGDVNQCWGDPCQSANGENICLALKKGYKRCAANFVPLGTRLEIEGFGQCLVTDRMNSRYHYRVDIAMKLEEKQRAKDFGLQYLNVSVLK